jgi:hypothetical protein
MALFLEILWNLRFGIFPFVLIVCLVAKYNGVFDEEDARRNAEKYIEPW